MSKAIMVARFKKNNVCWIVLFVGLFISTYAFATRTLHEIMHGTSYPLYPKINYGQGKQAEKIKRGEYLVKAGDCLVCHTDILAGGKPFAGGLPLKVPSFGIVYSTNITSDQETGIGNWTDKQFINAMRNGISPNGSYIMPVLPYVYFNNITDEDLLDMKAYLAAVPAVKQKNKKLSLVFPFNWRFLQIGWRTLFFTFSKTGPYKPDPKKSAQWNRGAYLVEGLGHCGMCHTPKNFLGADKTQYFLTGSAVSGFYAPNITSTRLDKVSIKEIEDVFLKNIRISGGEVIGPMKEVNHYSLTNLIKEDIAAIAVYLKTVKSKSPPKPEQLTTDDPKAGEKIYNKYCKGCHSLGVGGAPIVGNAKSWAPFIKKGLKELYKNTINGVPGTAMPPKGACMDCSVKQIQAVVRYMVDHSAEKEHGEH